MPSKKSFSQALAILLLLSAGCDKGGPRLPLEAPFEGSVHGVVSSESANLLGVTVRLSGGVVRETQTSSGGSFSFPGLPAGEYVVTISGYPEDLQFPTTAKPASLQKGSASARVDFFGTIRTDASIQGMVIVEGIGLEGISVSLSGPDPRSFTTDSQGLFAFSQLKRGSYTVAISGFDPAFYAFPTTSESVNATGGTPAETHFAGTLVPQAPEAPEGLSVLTAGSATLDLSWTDQSDDETRTEVERKQGSDGSWSTVGSLEPNLTAFQDVGLTPATTFFYRVRACNDVGCSEFSNESSATTDDVPPASPTTLVATKTGPYGIDLSWSDGSINEESFEVERKVGTGGDWAQLISQGPDITTAQDSGLQPNTSYTYRVRACNDMGCSPFSNEADATTDEIPPVAPSQLVASPTGPSAAWLGWADESDNETRFDVERRSGPGGIWTTITAVGPDISTFGDSGLTANTSYTYRVRACNQAGCSAYSNEAVAVTEEVPPEAPTSLTAVASGSTTVELVWTDASQNEAQFQLQRREGTAGTWLQIGTPGPNTTSLGDGGLTPNTTYRYRIRACNDVGCSSFSAEALATTDEVPPAPPSALVATSTGTSTISLGWTDHSGNEAHFQVDRKEGAGGSWAPLISPGSNQTTWGDSGLTPVSTYYYRVRACNAAGCSSYTSEAGATTADVPPSAPGALAAAATGATTIDVSWIDLSSNETEFRIERKEGVGGSWSHVGTRPQDSTSFPDSGLSPGLTYFYRVTACHTTSCSGPSGEASATTPGTPPEAPSGLSAVATGPSTADLRWVDNSAGELGFRVERKEGAAGTYATVENVPTNSTAFSDTGLSANTEYFYRVIAHNASGDSPPSNEASSTTWPGGGPNLSIPSLYLTQSTQTLAGDVPLVADKGGYLRVFAVASEANPFQPTVRVRFYHGGGLVHTEVITAPGASVPTGVIESSLTTSWNVAVPASLIQPGLTILADVDPTDQIAEGNEADNNYPLDGSPMAMDVRTTTTFEVTFVPVRQSVNDLVGNVTTGNVAQYMDVALRMLPMAQADVTVHAEYITDAPVLESGNGNGAWGTILSEVNGIRIVEGTSRYYYGVVKTSYGGGVAGMGYLGWPTAIGWDRLPSGSGVAAHEWGHNWNLRHAPGCGAGSPDPSFPYADGKIGVWGLDITSTAVKSPSTHYDFMSYCGPDWISDYFYKEILDFRQIFGSNGTPAQPEPALLVWGRVENGQIILEPAFEVTTAPKLPSGRGAFRVEGVDRTGRPLFSEAFDLLEVPDAEGVEGHFAFAIPMDMLDRTELSRLTVSGGGMTRGSMESRTGPQMATAPEPEFTSVGGSAVEITWDANSFPMALVRNPTTGEILSFARGGHVALPNTSAEIELVFTDGLRNSGRVRHRVR